MDSDIRKFKKAGILELWWDKDLDGFEGDKKP